MSDRLVWVCVLVFFISGSAFAGTGMQDSLSQQKSKSGNFLDRLDDLKNKAVLATGAIKKHGVPRVVARGARPEIIIKGEVIYFNGGGVRIGESLASWEKVLSAGRRCRTGDGITICLWDNWGLEIGTDDKKKPSVQFMNLFLSLVDDDGENSGKVNASDGKNNRSENRVMLRRAFSGYLELDGFGIDSKTKFWEIQSETRDGKLTCGLRDCSHPGGAFGKKANIFLILNGNSDQATLRQFSISADNVD